MSPADALAGVYAARQRGNYYRHPTSKIGQAAVIFPGAFIGPNVVIGARCVIGVHAVIGAPGFGYTTDEQGRHTYREHKEGVVIGDDVSIGAHTTVDQGRHRPTILGRGTKLDDHVHVGHNAHVGEDCLLAAHVMLSGTVTLGDRVRMAPGSLVRDHRSVGDDALVGVGAVVVKDVPAGETWAGNPARPL